MIGGYSPQYAFEINEPEALAQRIRDNSRPTGTRLLTTTPEASYRVDDNKRI
jgi:hypothetical protein